MPFYDENGNYRNHGGYYDDNFSTTKYSGERLKEIITTNYENMLSNIEKAKQSSFRMFLTEYYCYFVEIGKSTTQIENFNQEFTFNKGFNVSMETTFDDESIDISSVKDKLQDTLNYTFNMVFDYSLDADDCVDTFNIIITIKTAE